MRILANIQDNLEALLHQEDTDGDNKITVLDKGPKRFILRLCSGDGFEVAGIFALSNLLQELVLASEAGNINALLDVKKLFENPVDRFSRLIRDQYWDNLTRTIDHQGLSKILTDDKMSLGGPPRIYVPHADRRALHYFEEMVAKRPIPNLQVVPLPEEISPEFVKGINHAPGILSLALKPAGDGLEGVPFVVPGGRFNEMYGWDSYFETLGLVLDGRVDLAKAMVDNFVYEIDHYGKILNANRSYYLTRTQPPFFTSMLRCVHAALPKSETNSLWLKGALLRAIHEYRTVWMGGKRLVETGLNRYHGSGIGIPPEAEPHHFDAVLRPFARQAQMDIAGYHRLYMQGKIDEPALDEYFRHDRAVRESGHDTTYRLDNRAAHLNTVDLNSLLYKYETDIAECIDENFGGALKSSDDRTETSAEWKALAAKRKARMNALLWNEERGMFFDYDFKIREQTLYESATTFYPLWAGLTTNEQADRLVKEGLPLLEAPGGLLSSTEASRGVVNAERPLRQWDYPFGWAPHQMLLWEGLQNYGYQKVAERLAYRWLYMIVRNAVDYNGTIPEKYDVVERSHRVLAEYGNVGTEFEYVTREGFGWMNASYQVGLQLISKVQRASLRKLIPAEWLFGVAPAS